MFNDKPNAPDLWDLARQVLTVMTMALGAPSAIAAIGALSRTTRRDIVSWLAPFEMFVRKLLIVEASKLPRPSDHHPPPAPWTPRRLDASINRLKFKRPRPRLVVDPQRPATWRVSFHLLIPKDPLKREPRTPEMAARIRRLGPPVLVREVWRTREEQRQRELRIALTEQRRANRARRLAERFEALRRVVLEPGPHAERLAHKLWRQRGGAAWSAERLVLQKPPRRCRAFPEEALAWAQYLAEEVLEAFRLTPPIAIADSS